MIRVLIADDHTVVRKGLKQIFSVTDDIDVLDEAGSGAEAISLIGKNSYDVVLLDISMPGRNGLDILKQIKMLNPKLPILIFSMHAEDEYAIRCYKAGAAGYLRKDSSADEVIAAIRKVARGGRYMNATLSERLPFGWASSLEELPHGRLSDREFQIVFLLGAGKTTTDIAEELCLSAQTISTYKARILEKMQMPSIAHVIRYLIENKLLP